MENIDVGIDVCTHVCPTTTTTTTKIGEMRTTTRFILYAVLSERENDVGEEREKQRDRETEREREREREREDARGR